MVELDTTGLLHLLEAMLSLLPEIHGRVLVLLVV
jgi:hypothetical protein